MLHQPISNELKIFGDGKQSKPYIFIDDILAALQLLEHKFNNGFNVFNVGSSDNLTVNEIANIIIELTNSNSKVIYKNLPEDDPKIRCPDISRANEFLGWKPNIALQEGLLKTIKYFKEVK